MAAVSSVVEYAGRFHPLVVHFPIALLLAAGACEIVGQFRQRAGPHPATPFCVAASAVTAPISAALGWAYAATRHISASEATLLFYHRWLGTGTALMAIAAFAALRSGRVVALRIVLYFSMLAVAVTGHLGGLLSNGADYFSLP